MTKIKTLPIQIINQIAAGEVIERPSSIIKELVENSIDAGATEIEIYINNGGKTLISVIDNGAGMLKEDLPLSLAIHATSKLDNNNLFNINSLGFRGEALASIAAVAKITINSFDTQKQQGFSISAQNSIISSNIKQIALKQGTTVIVEDLFFSTPARLKFLKNDNTEALHCYALIKKLALANFNCRLKLFNNNKLVFNYYSVKEQYLDTIQERLTDIMSKDFINNGILINSTNELFSLYGYISNPTYNTNNSNLQYFNINNRYIKDKVISNALKYAYNDVLERSKFPIFGLWMTINPAEIDINVNPSKSEVRFQDPQFIRHLIYNIIKQALANTNKTNSSLAENLLQKGYNYNTNNQNNSQLKRSPKLNEFKQTPYQALNLHNMSTIIQSFGAEADKSNHNSLIENIPSLIENTTPLGFAAAQLHNNWIISKTKNGFLIIDQHAAHERITEEILKNHYLNNTIAVQQLLDLYNLTLDNEGILILTEYKEQIQKMGIEFTITANNVNVTSLPALLAKGNPKDIIEDIINNIKDTSTILNLEMRFKQVIARLACHSSIRAGRSMNIVEMNDLLRKMEATPNYSECSHGRPTFIEITLNSLEKVFGRLG